MQHDEPDGTVSRASLIVHALPPEDMARYASMFDCYRLEAAADRMVLRHASGGGELEAPPQGVAAVVSGAASPDVAAWAHAAGLDAPVVRHHAELPALLAAFAGRVARSARHAADLATRLATLRAEHENLHNAHEGLRAFVQDRALALPALAFLALPDTDASRLPPHMAEVTQAIPCDIRMLRAISLHLPELAVGDGILRVSLLSPENPDLLAEWHVGYAALRPGWTSFVFAGVGPAVAGGASLRLQFRTLAGAPPRFSLARPHLRPDRTAMLDGDRVERPLAFRAWSSVPGAPLALTAQLWPAIQPGPVQPALSRIELLATDDFEVEDVRGLGEKLDFRPVRKLPRQRRILLHPLGRLPTIARIPGGCPAGTQEVRVEVETDHAEAAPIEYGACLSATPHADGEYRFDAAADWVVVPAKTQGTLVLRFDAPLTEAADLYLVSRCPPGSTSDWGWAHVTRLSLLGQFAATAFQPFAAP